MMYPNFLPLWTGFFVGAINSIFGDLDAGIPHIIIVVFDTEQVFLKLQVTNFNIK